MHYATLQSHHTDAFISLFQETFAASEGANEGDMLKSLVKQLLDTTEANALFGFVAIENDQVVGGVLFSRLILSSHQNAFMLSPLAVHPSFQKQGVGQGLVCHALGELKAAGVSLVVTYGDPAFYQKVGFEALSEDTLAAPHPLSQPIGWLAQTLDGSDIQPTQDRCECVAAFNNPELW
ncbi:MAG: GNAT family N-acetyltransferase [Pontibacterium sp.]